VVHLVIGLDRATDEPWHRHVAAQDVESAVEIAIARARASAVDLVVAAVLGPYSGVLPYRER
jgi:hypothetical protein